MDSNTDAEGNLPEESSVIKELRKKVADLERESRNAEAAARAKIERESKASQLMPEGYKGLAGYFEQEVDGDLTSEAAEQWLADRGITASLEPSTPDAETPSRAQDLEAVTDLGAAVAAAGAETSPPTAFDEVDKVLAQSKGIGNLPDVTKMIERALNQG